MTTSMHVDYQTLFSHVCEAWNRADARGLAAHYAVDGRLVNPFGESLQGRQAIEEGFMSLFAGPMAGVRTDILVESVREVTTDLAVIDGTQTLAGPLPDLHFTALVRSHGDAGEIIECRPYAFLPPPAE